MKCEDCVHHEIFQMISSGKPYGYGGDIPCYGCYDNPHTPKTSMFVPKSACGNCEPTAAKVETCAISPCKYRFPTARNTVFADMANASEGPDYSDPREVLKAIALRDDTARFISWLNAFSLDEDGDLIDYAIPVSQVAISGQLRDRWIEWRVKNEHK